MTSRDSVEIAERIRRIGEDRQSVTSDDLAQLRDFFGNVVLPANPTRRMRAKHDQHVVNREEWPSDTTADDYLENLRAVVTDWRSGVYLAQDAIEESWTLYFVGRVRRSWRGPMTGARVVVLFNGEQQ